MSMPTTPEGWAKDHAESVDYYQKAYEWYKERGDVKSALNSLEWAVHYQGKLK